MYLFAPSVFGLSEMMTLVMTFLWLSLFSSILGIVSHITLAASPSSGRFVMFSPSPHCTVMYCTVLYKCFEKFAMFSLSTHGTVLYFIVLSEVWCRESARQSRSEDI